MFLKRCRRGTLLTIDGELSATRVPVDLTVSFAPVATGPASGPCALGAGESG